MSLRTYVKSTSYAVDTSVSNTYFHRNNYSTYSFSEDNSYIPQQITLWDLVTDFYSTLKKITGSSKGSSLFVPAILVLIGGVFIYSQFSTNITEFFRNNNNFYSQESLNVVAADYIPSKLQYISNPGGDYFKKVSNELTKTGFGTDAKSMAYAGTMYISIPSLGIDALPVKANVDSTTGNAYEQVLNSALAHFKGTSLPLSETQGNTVIYGHSTGGSYAPSAGDVVSAFSFLPNLKVGDAISITLEGKVYNYRMQKSSIVQPDDFSIVHSTSGRETLTLFTCYPPGNNSQRFVVTASAVN